ncbi:LysR family transcriptional regulator [Kribbella sp. CA-293567]|uniref:LysR family transcriptional regulator n=1 Tax=Kribbella sp. CA-293567 TaxID=3002436 RepID=UPI0022DE6A8E|nr:LysR family transcriptional regulator [Kribbella sp. CA-293567]WBQ04137.1 LysR family transcriptional regulator [Kribbella sp. CA-293567]
MDPEIRHLRAICAIAEAGSVTRAAALLGISQPALTGLLQRFERSLGGQLFERGRTGVRPTALGERALQRARLVLAELDSFAGDLTLSAGTSLRSLRMGTAHMECVGTMVERVQTALDPIEISVQIDASAISLAQALTHHRSDFAVIGMNDDSDVPLAPDVAQRTVLPRLPFFIALSSSHPLAGRPEIDLADLADEAWISPPGADDGSLASLRAACRRAGYSPKVRYEAPSGGGRQLIQTGRAVQLVEPTSLGATGMAIRRLAGDPLRGRLVLAWRRSRITDDQVETTYLAIARAYTDHALRSPTYAPWWAAHPEVHPRTS